MRERKSVTIGRNKYQMYRIASTGWVFVESRKSGQTYQICQTADGEIVSIYPERALRDASNEELAQAWVNS